MCMFVCPKNSSKTVNGSDLKFAYVIFFLSFWVFIDLNKQAVIYKAKALKQIQINSKGQP